MKNIYSLLTGQQRLIKSNCRVQGYGCKYSKETKEKEIINKEEYLLLATRITKNLKGLTLASKSKFKRRELLTMKNIYSLLIG